MTRRRKRVAGEGGFSLIELLVTLVIMGTAIIILVGGTVIGAKSSSTQREKADGEIVLHRFIDHLKAQEFIPCDDGNVVYPDPPWRNDRPANGYVLEIGDCVPEGDDADRLQRLTVVVEARGSGDGVSSNDRLTVEILKRNTAP